MIDQESFTNEELREIMQIAAGTIYFVGQRLIQLHNTLVARINSGPHVCQDWMLSSDLQAAAKGVTSLDEPFGVIDAILHLNQPAEETGRPADNVVPLPPKEPEPAKQEPRSLALVLKKFNLDLEPGQDEDAGFTPDPNYKADFDPNVHFAKENGPIVD